MRLKTVLFCDQKTAERNAGQPDWAIISITESGGAQLRDGWLDVLRLRFQDTDDINDPFIFQPYHAWVIDDFVEKVKQNGATGILVHCYAGVSRSAAVAKWIATCEELPFNERYQLYNKHVYNVLRKHAQSKMHNAG